MTMGAAKVTGSAGVTATAAAAGLAAIDMLGVRLPQVQYMDGLYLMLLAGGIALIGAACLQVALAHASSRSIRATQAAFTAGVDYGRGTRTRVSVRGIVDDAA